ncbi:TetR/AcrR family transcriptional regulator [Microbacterium sp. JB110]|uniref:TetR/AcrR family transcriptional regulator n=1 Tax=Microbacterium sp. JB110 TaxID=2024477 RepID=UPI0020160641|nr:TetR/AcrR family transcriptional regulator [Microbacterium sp. JB110]
MMNEPDHTFDAAPEHPGGGGERRPGPRGAVTRERILSAASELFYAHGIHATSADRIIERADVTKVTFYRHFRTKVDVIVAYLERQAASEAEAVTGVREFVGSDGGKALELLAQGIGAETCRPGFRGCSFINAAAEYPDPAHPVRVVVDRHRAWFAAELADMARGAGADAPDLAADELMMLRDGAMVNGYLSDADRVSSALARAFRAVIESHGAGRGRSA